MYHGSQKERAEARQDMKDRAGGSLRRNCPFDVLLSTYETCVNAADDRQFLRKFAFQYIVLDEAHCLKNTKSLRFVHLSKLAASCHGKTGHTHIVLLTGTPIQNNASELAALVSFVFPNSLAKLNALIDAGHDEAAVVSRLKTILKPFILRRYKRDVLKDMVEKKQILSSIPMTVTQTDCYQGVIAHSRAKMIKKSVVTAAAAAAAAADDDVVEVSGAAKKPLDESAYSFTGQALSNLIMQLRKCSAHPLLHRGGVHFNDER
jgi:SNF2 family DNA or RNA helicase